MRTQPVLHPQDIPSGMPGSNALHPTEMHPVPMAQLLQTHLPAPVTSSGQGVEDRQFWGSHPFTSLSAFIAHLLTLLSAV